MISEKIAITIGASGIIVIAIWTVWTLIWDWAEKVHNKQVEELNKHVKYHIPMKAMKKSSKKRR